MQPPSATSSGEQGVADRKRVWRDFATGVAGDPGVVVDETDLRILSALEADGRRPVSSLAKEIHASRVSVARRLERILDSGVATVTLNINPPVLGYRFLAMIGIKVQPSSLGSAVKRVCGLPSVHWVMTVSGVYDVVAYAMFGEPRELSKFMETEMGSVAGIASVETAIGLGLRKFGFPYLASSHLKRRAHLDLPS